jgi:hypothetical protein
MIDGRVKKPGNFEDLAKVNNVKHLARKVTQHKIQQAFHKAVYWFYLLNSQPSPPEQPFCIALADRQ